MWVSDTPKYSNSSHSGETYKNADKNSYISRPCLHSHTQVTVAAEKRGLRSGYFTHMGLLLQDMAVHASASSVTASAQALSMLA